jgi:hypothetical protein
VRGDEGQPFPIRLDEGLGDLKKDMGALGIK